MENKSKGFFGLLAVIALFFAEHIKTCTPELEDAVKYETHSRINQELADEAANKLSHEHEPENVADKPSTINNSESNAQEDNSQSSKKTTEQSNKDNPSTEDVTSEKSFSTYAAENEKLKKKGCYLTDKDLSDKEILDLSNQNIHFVLNKKLYDLQTSQTDFKVIIVSSNDNDEMRVLYDVDNHNAKSIRKLFSQLDGYENVTVVHGELELNVALMNAELKGDEPIIVFHNKKNTLYNRAISDYKASVITCNSFRLEKNTNKFQYSTEFLGIKNVVEGVKVAHRKENLFEFYSTFCGVYHERILRESNAKALYVSAGVVATGGGISAIYYNSKS